jgi:hypothetical protein
MDTDSVLTQFNSVRRKAINEYRRFVREGVGQGTVKELTGGGLIRSRGGWSQVLGMRRRGQAEDFDERILGGGEFVNQILQETEEQYLRQLKHKRSGKTLCASTPMPATLLRLNRVCNAKNLFSEYVILTMESGRKAGTISSERTQYPGLLGVGGIESN